VVVHVQLAAGGVSAVAPEHKQARLVLQINQVFAQVAVSLALRERGDARALQPRMQLRQQQPAVFLCELAALLVDAGQVVQQVFAHIHAQRAAEIGQWREFRVAFQHVQQLQRAAHSVGRPGGPVAHIGGGAAGIDAGDGFQFEVHGFSALGSQGSVVSAGSSSP
jgi:hypothetical protein